jgi:hypothetical protein
MQYRRRPDPPARALGAERGGGLVGLLLAGKQVAPLPDMRASSTPGRASIRASASPTSGAKARAGVSKSLARPARRSARVGRSGKVSLQRPESEKSSCRAAKTSAVGKATPGLTSTSQAGGSGGARVTRSPIPATNAGRP